MNQPPQLTKQLKPNKKLFPNHFSSILHGALLVLMHYGPQNVYNNYMTYGFECCMFCDGCYGFWHNGPILYMVQVLIPWKATLIHELGFFQFCQVNELFKLKLDPKSYIDVKFLSLNRTNILEDGPKNNSTQLEWSIIITQICHKSIHDLRVLKRSV